MRRRSADAVCTLSQSHLKEKRVAPNPAPSFLVHVSYLVVDILILLQSLGSKSEDCASHKPCSQLRTPSFILWLAL